ncbi:MULTISPECIES: cell division protein FtsK [unclassified Sporosarcina]|uniref:cell division protein FtsK n=1 Tax=unclassified Sporosarcina TaxID=2647733 RepID=UPI000C169FD3|nr:MULTISPECIES: cell division protein FtsK [unclassified Sporosarcina]PID04522.1 cell division protein FtsK [Sporosarcina sp. P30]PID07880.1 cell division protein FtsK [Sporosarcina sp. P31]PID10862.1 cell division protein FtsK [Sporosarcina sp. P32b]
MKAFKKVIKFLNRMKDIDREGLSDKEKEYLDRIPTQNPYGLIGMILGGIAFTFGSQYGFIPVITLAFCVVTIFTFDKEKEDNPWPFYVGIILSLIGLNMFINGELHELIF